VLGAGSGSGNEGGVAGADADGLDAAAGSIVKGADLPGDVTGLLLGGGHDGAGLRDLGTQRGQDHPQAIVDPRLRAAFADFEEFDAAIDDLLAAGDRVIASISLHGRLRGGDVAIREAWVCRLAEGAVIDVLCYRTLQAAVATIAPRTAAEAGIAVTACSVPATPRIVARRLSPSEAR